MAVTGATGFVGSVVLRGLLEARADGRVDDVRALVRTPPGRRLRDEAGPSWCPADLTDPSSLSGALDGVHVLVHLASRVSGEARACEAVNVRGTATLIEEARRSGVRRVVQLSTTAVYGAGPHRGLTVNEIAPAPVSAASATRLESERHVLATGGTVLRAGLIVGQGDRWVVPALAELLARVPALWDGGRGLLSLIDVEDLARLITTTALMPDAPPTGIHHAAHTRPVRVRDLLTTLASLGVLPSVTGSWPWDACVRRLREVPGPMSERQFSLLALDHWYRGEEIWRLTGCPEGPGPLARLASASAWYRSFLAERPWGPQAVRGSEAGASGAAGVVEAGE
ncbi:NAD-dependent epimerase/dehydratase family protein [Streptomyces sp. CB01373]|uniref:NAD-dependent epimerase/dehydratase family protein n=1 Tax=Streptomyces sp. CB01373 TaxID=2020325 RepID=UPI001F1B3770|nr:NAD(P)-dependent oxidoreductase [Streptomyces sp. CB01373]